MKSCMHLVGTVVWLLTALGCIHLGLMGIGHDPLVMLNLTEFSRYIMLAMGVAGLVSIALFFIGSGACNCSHQFYCNNPKNPNQSNSSY